jgi:hypothetical protein
MTSSFYTKPEIQVNDRIASVNTFSDSIEKLNSVILKRMTNNFYPIGKTNFDSRSDSVIDFHFVSSQGFDLKSFVLYFNAKLPEAVTRACFDDLLPMFTRVVCLINDSIFTDTTNFNIIFKNLWYQTCSEEFQKSYQGQLCGAWRYNHQPVTRLSSMKLDALYETEPNIDPNGLQPLLYGIETKAHEDSCQSASGRSYAIPLSFIFSIFRIDQILPLELVKSLKLSFYLAPYAETVLHLPAKAAAFPATDAAALLLHPYRLFSSYANEPAGANQYYLINNVMITGDVVDLHPSYLSEIRSLAQSQTGFFVSCENYSSFLQSLTAPSVTLNITQPISHLKDIFIVPRRSMITNAYSTLDSNHNQFKDYRITIGSIPLTLNPVNSISQSYIESRKAWNSLGNLNGSTLLNERMFKDYCFCISQSCEALSVNGIPSNVDLKLPASYVRCDLNFNAIADPDIAATPLLVGAVQANYALMLIVILHHDIGLHFSNGGVERLT